jgi:hypothetical protein
MDDTQFAELWLDTHAEGGNITTMVENYRKAVPETEATDQSLKTALSTRATKIRSGFIAIGKTEEEANALFPKFPRATRTGEKLQSALDRILELANAAKEQAAEVDAEADIAADSDSE